MNPSDIRPDAAVEQRFLLEVAAEIGRAVVETHPSKGFWTRFKHKPSKPWLFWKRNPKHHYWVIRRFTYYDYLLLDDGSYGILVKVKPSAEERKQGAFKAGFWKVENLPPYELDFIIKTTDMPIFAQVATEILVGRLSDPGFSWQLAFSLGKHEEWERLRNSSD